MAVAVSSQPMGLAGCRRATTTPTAANDSPTATGIPRSPNDA
jgi:hypothetical protein